MPSWFLVFVSRDGTCKVAHPGLHRSFLKRIWGSRPFLIPEMLECLPLEAPSRLRCKAFLREVHREYQGETLARGKRTISVRLKKKNPLSSLVFIYSGWQFAGALHRLGPFGCQDTPDSLPGAQLILWLSTRGQSTWIPLSFQLPHIPHFLAHSTSQ